MTGVRLFIALASAAIPVVALFVIFRRVRGAAWDRRRVALLCALGAAAAAAALAGERAVRTWTGLSMGASPGATATALAYTFLFVAPMEEGAKALVLWAALRRNAAAGRLVGVLYGVYVAAGFAALDSAASTLEAEPTPRHVVRSVLGQPMQFFCAGLLGYALVRARGRGTRWVFLAAVFLHGLYDHIVFGRGPGMLALVVPILAAMGVLTWAVLRDVAPDSLPRSRLLAPLPEPPSLHAMRQALKRTEQPLKLHWIVAGALVNVGVVLASLSLAVYAGHRFGVDFAAADEADMRSNGPILLLGLAVLGAFPIAGYVVARASGTNSVLEPAMATALALLSVVGLLSVTAPVAVIFALAVAPVAFGLSCGGAWMGQRR